MNLLEIDVETNSEMPALSKKEARKLKSLNRKRKPQTGTSFFAESAEEVIQRLVKEGQQQINDLGDYSSAWEYAKRKAEFGVAALQVVVA